MEITLEQVEKVRSCTGASYEEAKAALEACGGSLLDAVILLERRGKDSGPRAGGYSTRAPGPAPEPERTRTRPNWAEVRRALKGLVSNCLSVTVEVWKQGRLTCAIPLLAALILCVLEPWVALGLLLVGLCFGYRVHVAGRGTEEWGARVNEVSDQIADTVHDAVSSLRRESKKIR